MSAILSTDQIDALFTAAKDGQLQDEARPATPRRPRRVREIDFSRPAKLAQDQTRRLERAHEAFCRAAETRFSTELRAPVRLEVISIEQLTWSSALGQIPHPSIFGLVEVAPLNTSIAVTADVAMVFEIVERLLGGPGGGQPTRHELTEIELALTRRIFERLTEQLSAIWDELLGVTLSLRALEAQLQGVQLAPPSEPTVAITVEARIGATSSTMTIVVPYGSIAPVADRLSGSAYEQASDQQVFSEEGEKLRRALSGVRVSARVEVGAVELTLRDLLGLKEGDVLRLGTPADAGAAIYAGDVELYRARPGRSGGQRAVEVLERVEDVE